MCVGRGESGSLGMADTPARPRTPATKAPTAPASSSATGTKRADHTSVRGPGHRAVTSWCPVHRPAHATAQMRKLRLRRAVVTPRSPGRPGGQEGRRRARKPPSRSPGSRRPPPRTGAGVRGLLSARHRLAPRGPGKTRPGRKPVPRRRPLGTRGAGTRDGETPAGGRTRTLTRTACVSTHRCAESAGPKAPGSRVEGGRRAPGGGRERAVT